MVWAVAMHPDGQTVVTGSGDHKARVWRVPAPDAFGLTLRHPPNKLGNWWWTSIAEGGS